nr:MAG TPA: DNA-binding protein [Caudoviricetes sp.]
MSVSRVAKLTFLTRQTIYNIENGLGSKATINYLDLFYGEFESKLRSFQNK